MTDEYGISYQDLFDRHVTPVQPIPTTLTPRGRPVTPVKAVIFDIYGTLFVSGSGDIGTDVIPAAARDEMERLISEFDFAFSPQELMEAYFLTIRAEHERKKAFGIEFPEVRIERVWSEILNTDDIIAIRRFALAFELIVNPVYPMPHLDSMLSALSRSKLKLGIISNAQFYTPLAFEVFCGAAPENLGFDPGLVVYSYQHDHAKPSPLLFTLAARRLEELNIPPGSVLYVGNDMLNDVYAARIAGFQTALFAGDERSLRLRTDDPRCDSLIPDACLTDLNQLPAMLGITSQQQG